MITAQDIREKTFNKAKLSGYDMSEVDDFLEEIAEDITAAQKENAVLKSKMKVLVDKIEEYRSNEEALNMALLSAQKLAVQIENDARARSAQMLSEADAQVKTRLGTIPEQLEAQEKKLAAARESSASFFADLREMFTSQLTKLDDIEKGIIRQPEAAKPAAAPAQDVDEAIRTIEQNVSRIKPESDLKLDLSDTFDDNRPAPRSGNDFGSTQPFSL